MSLVNSSGKNIDDDVVSIPSAHSHVQTSSQRSIERSEVDFCVLGHGYFE